MQTIKKKKIKSTKKHKHHQIEHTTESIDETKITQTSISEQEHIKHKATSKTHEQTIKQISLELAPEQIESIVFDENTIPMDTESCPKPIETQPIFHAQYIQAASMIEHETHIHSNDTPKTQKCSVNISEITPLIISQIDENESVENKRPDRLAQSVQQLSPKIITSSAAIADQVVPCDNVNIFETKIMPATVVAEATAIPYESKIVYEQVASQKEDELAAASAPDFQQAHETISAQCSIEIHAIDLGESEKAIFGKYEPAIQSATCLMVSNTALSTEETLVQNTPAKFYPEMIIATEIATAKFVEQIPYQTHETCTSETENVLHLSEKPHNKQAHVEFADMHAITMEQTDVSECETPSQHVIPDSLKAFAKDSISLHKQVQTGFSQAIDSVIPNESIPCTTKTAVVSLEEMGGKFIETVNIFQSEQPFESTKPLLQLEASSEYTSHEGFTISETLVQESNIEFLPALLQTPAKATQTREEQKIPAQSDELLLETTSDYRRTDIEQNSKAQVKFEPQMSIILDTVLTHDLEKTFDTNIKTSQPHYTMDTSTHSSILISEPDIKEESSDLSIESVSQKDAKRTLELHKTHHQQSDVQVFSTTQELSSDDKVPMHNVQVSFELQKSTIGESVIAHDLEQIFETQLKSNEPYYTTKKDVNSSIIVSETHAQESDSQFFQQPIVSNTAFVTQELYKAPESSTDQILETLDDYKRHESHPEHNANIRFELQKSTIGEETMAHDAEHNFEQPKEIVNEPQYSMALNETNSPVIVSETQIIDTESSFNVSPIEGRHLNVTISPKQFSHVGSVSETVLYDSTELIQPSFNKVVLAKTEPIVFHELAVETATASESVDQFKINNFREQTKNAATAVVTKTALNVTVEQTAETLDKFEEKTINKEQPTIKHDMVPINPIVVGETETSEHSTYFDSETAKTAIGNVSTIKHRAANVDENWPIERVENFEKTAAKAEESLKKNLVQSIAIQSTTVIASDTFKEFQHQIDKLQKPKYLIDESSGIQTENIISQENVEPNKFLLTHETAQGHIIEEFEVQHRCEQVEQVSVESTDLLQPLKTRQTVVGTKNVSDVLTAAKVEEVFTNQSGDTFESEKPTEQHSKIVQECFNVVGQLAQQIPLERENLLSAELKLKEEYPKKSVEGRISYSAKKIEVFEKESELTSQNLSETHKVNETMEPLLSTSHTSEDTILSNVQFGIENEENRPTKVAVSKIERLHEEVHIEDKIINETTSDIIKTLSKTATAEPSVESKKPIQIEKPGTYEKESNLSSNIIEPKICDLSLENNLKVATSHITQIIEQTDTKPYLELKGNNAAEVASETNQKIIYESVYLESHKDIKETARTIETQNHAVKVTEHFPLYKETVIDEKQTDQLLIKSLVHTQETTELRSAETQSEIKTILDVHISEKADKITNQKKILKSKETTIFDKGRWYNQIYSYYYRNFGKTHFR